MAKIGIVSCNKWKEKIDEDIRLKLALQKIGIDADIIAWEEDRVDGYTLLILRSVWGYQNDYERFKAWLLSIQQKKIPLLNDPDIIMSNILKNRQFEILDKYDIEHVDTRFIMSSEFCSKRIKENLSRLLNKTPVVIKPTISGSGENTFLIDIPGTDSQLPNTIMCNEIEEKYQNIIQQNKECGIMLQPYVPEINSGEYSCVFINGELTHTMLRFPNVFHLKRRPYLVKKPPFSITELARKVEKIPEFSNYLYMRVDMVLIGKDAKIMEVELAEPDLLTKYIDDEKIQNHITKTLARSIKGRLR